MPGYGTGERSARQKQCPASRLSRTRAGHPGYHQVQQMYLPPDRPGDIVCEGGTKTQLARKKDPEAGGSAIRKRPLECPAECQFNCARRGLIRAYRFPAVLGIYPHPRLNLKSIIDNEFRVAKRSGTFFCTGGGVPFGAAMT